MHNTAVHAQIPSLSCTSYKKPMNTRGSSCKPSAKEQEQPVPNRQMINWVADGKK